MRRLQRLLAALPITPATTTTTDTVTPSRPGTCAAVLQKEGDYWRLGWEGSEFRLRDRVGLHHLVTLIASPAREFLAVDLVRSVTRRASTSTDSSRRNDLGTIARIEIARIEAEVEALTREVARSLGIAGRGRDSRSPIERARASARG